MRRVDTGKLIQFGTLLKQALPQGLAAGAGIARRYGRIDLQRRHDGRGQGHHAVALSLVANAHQLQAWVSMGPEERMLAVLPLFHGFGMSVTMNAPLLVGAEIVLMPRFPGRMC